MRRVEELFVAETGTLRDVLVRSNATRRGIVIITDDEHHLIGVITDGDIRREMMAGTDQAVSVQQLLARKGRPHPVTARMDASHGELMDLLRNTGLSHIPLIDDEHKVRGLVALEDLLKEDELALQAVVMAGGKGTRLHPLTEETPKPMLPVGDKPLMEHIIAQLSATGIRQVHVTTHYLAEKITAHFGSGEAFGVRLTYGAEDRLLGTAGGLGLMAAPDRPLLVINGDILTQVNFRAMMAYHREHSATMTIAVRSYEVKIPYGVVESDGVYVSGIVEKPSYTHFVNAGIYLLEPKAHDLIPKNERFDMTDLIHAVLANDLKVVTFPIWEYWRDIGQHEDYIQAQADVKHGIFSK
jgi:dTDP-glucose pyrophosphorylase